VTLASPQLRLGRPTILRLMSGNITGFGVVAVLVRLHDSDGLLGQPKLNGPARRASPIISEIGRGNTS
jgi:hypothetical protein